MTPNSSPAPVQPAVESVGGVTPIQRPVFQAQLRQVAASMIGIKYTHLGRGPEGGLDCYGVVLEFYKRLGFPLCELFFNYELNWWKTKNYVLEHDKDFDRVPKPVIGGVVAMKSGDSFVPNHLAIVLDDIHILNTDQRVGVHKMRIFAIKPAIVVSYQRKGLRVVP